MLADRCAAVDRLPVTRDIGPQPVILLSWADRRGDRQHRSASGVNPEGLDMKKVSRLPHEQPIADNDSGFGPEHDRLPVDSDVEGHGAASPDSFPPSLPGT